MIRDVRTLGSSPVEEGLASMAKRAAEEFKETVLRLFHLTSTETMQHRST